MVGELKILFSILKNPTSWLQVIHLVFFRPLRTRFRIRTHGMYNPCYYPAEITHEWSKINRVKNIHYSACSWPFILNDAKKAKPIPAYINFAGKKINPYLLEDFWKKQSDAFSEDPEFLNSIHRFHWAVESLSHGANADYVQLIYKLISKWIEIHSEPTTGIEWQPYTISERICNWILVWQAGRKITPPKEELERELNDVLLEHLFILSDHLEYPASGLVNNHILNNGRALYIGGRFLNRDDLAKLGVVIIKNNLPDMIGTSGFLLEASSHYHLLLTRTILEISIIAKDTGDNDLVIWLDPFLRRMLSASYFMIPSYINGLVDFPRIGDVSPDVPFDWFDPRPDTENTGWRNLWPFPDVEVIHYEYELDGWLKADVGDWCAYAYSHPDETGYPIGHGHDDFGSASLFYMGTPIIIDIGRLNYKSTCDGELVGTEAAAHNTVLTNGKGILFPGRGYASLKSRIGRRHAKCKLKNNGKSIIWSAITQNGQKWLRSIELESEGDVILRDSFEVDNETNIEGLLYLDHKLKPIRSETGSILLEGEDNFFEIEVNGADLVIIDEVLFYPHYGIRSTTHRLHWKSRVLNKSTSVTVNIRQAGYSARESA